MQCEICSRPIEERADAIMGLHGCVCETCVNNLNEDEVAYYRATLDAYNPLYPPSEHANPVIDFGDDRDAEPEDANKEQYILTEDMLPPEVQEYFRRFPGPAPAPKVTYTGDGRLRIPVNKPNQDRRKQDSIE